MVFSFLKLLLKVALFDDWPSRHFLEVHVRAPGVIEFAKGVVFILLANNSHVGEHSPQVGQDHSLHIEISASDDIVMEALRADLHVVLRFDCRLQHHACVLKQVSAHLKQKKSIHDKKSVIRQKHVHLGSQPFALGVSHWLPWSSYLKNV